MTVVSEAKQSIMQKLLNASRSERVTEREQETLGDDPHIVDMFSAPCFPDDFKFLDCVLVTKRQYDWDAEDTDEDKVEKTLHVPAGDKTKYARHVPKLRSGLPDIREARKEMCRDIAGVQDGFMSFSNMSTVLRILDGELLTFISMEDKTKFEVKEYHGIIGIRCPHIKSFNGEMLVIVHFFEGMNRVTAVVCEGLKMAELHYNNYEFFIAIRTLGKLLRE